MWARMTPPFRDILIATGRMLKPSLYGDEGYVITRALIEDGRRHLLLGAPFAVG